MAMALPAFAGVTGRVTSIGFQSFIRSDEWVPIVVQTISDEPAPHTFDLQVVQTDLDGDEVVYTRAGLTVNPGTQTFRTYFRPETVNGGLPASGSGTGSEFGKRLRVFLFDPATGKRTVRVGVSGSVPQALETQPMPTAVGQKLILVVGRSPNLSEFDPGRERLLGLAEQCYFVRVDPLRLPENALAYGAVDAVVWTDADAARLAPNQLRALRQYVQLGGTLVVIQNADLSRVAKFEDLLPVKLESSSEWTTAEPLKSILTPRNTPVPRNRAGQPMDSWQFAAPPYRMASAQPVDELTMVDTWNYWPDGRRTPLIARRLFGLGCVAWLAEDISDTSLATIDFGWPRLWERLMDWRDLDLTFTATEPSANLDKVKAKFATDSTRDIGASYYKGMDPPGLTAAKLSIAFVFFVVYWALAGPVSYLVLVARRKVTMSWFVYGAVAAGATALTVLISQVVLRGSPQLKHISVVRVRDGAADSARVMSQVGVYLPKDKRAAVAMPQSPELPPAAITPYGGDPRDNVSPRDYPYLVPVGADTDQSAVDVDIYFRSTLKKLQVDWSGKVPGGINGRPKLSASADPKTPPIEGRVSNDTGTDLAEVLLAFRSPIRTRGDLVIAIPNWKRGQTLELASLWQSGESKPEELKTTKRFGLNLFGSGKVMCGNWSNAVNFLYEDFRATALPGTTWDDYPQNYNRSFPIASLYGRCPPMTNFPNETSRVDLRRSGIRTWDVSPAVAAGAMVVIGKATGSLPVPLTVDGETPRGDGQLFYQAIVPLDRSALNAPDAKDLDKDEDQEQTN